MIILNSTFTKMKYLYLLVLNSPSTIPMGAKNLLRKWRALIESLGGLQSTVSRKIMLIENYVRFHWFDENDHSIRFKKHGPILSSVMLIFFKIAKTGKVNFLLHGTLITVFQNNVQSGEPKINLLQMSSDRYRVARNKPDIQFILEFPPKLICPPLPK